MGGTPFRTCGHGTRPSACAALTTSAAGAGRWSPTRRIARWRALSRSSARGASDQNVDDLHERAGSRNVVHMHGELLSARCLARPGARVAMTLARPACPACGQARLGSTSWFGGSRTTWRASRPPYASATVRAIGTWGRLPAAVSGGCSGCRRPHGGVEPQGSGVSWLFDEAYEGPATQVVPDWWLRCWTNRRASLLAGAAAAGRRISWA